jgi:peptidoglycan/LPS O-acetylase OafA/YrhL
MVGFIGELLNQFANTFAEWHALVFGMLFGMLAVILHERYNRRMGSLALLGAMGLALLSFLISVEPITGDVWYYIFGLLLPVLIDALVETIETFK